MNVSEQNVKKFFLDMLEKNGVDEDKWREAMNARPKNEREMEFKFDTEIVKDGFVLKFNYLITSVEITVNDEEARKAIEEGTME